MRVGTVRTPVQRLPIGMFPDHRSRAMSDSACQRYRSKGEQAGDVTCPVALWPSMGSNFEFGQVLVMNPIEPALDAPGPLEVVIEGHLTSAQFHAYMGAVREQMDTHKGNVCILVDCRRMTGYDREARQAFIDWHKASLGHIHFTAIVTENPLWNLVVSTMGLASGAHMKSFSSKQAAMNWLVQSPRT